MERVLRVLAASFDVPPNSEWSNELQQFKQRLDKLYIQLDPLVNPVHDE